MDKFPAKIEGNVLSTPGLDWGRKLKILEQNGDLLIVRRDSHKTWGGRGARQKSVPTLYMVIQLHDEEAEVLRREEPGRNWRKILPDLRTQCSTTKS